MKTDYVNYLKTLNMTPVLIDRVKEVVAFYDRYVVAGKIKTIFVSEYIGEDGNHTYENLWIITDEAVMEAHQFLEGDEFDSAILVNNVKYWTIEKMEYDFENYNSKSRMLLKFTLGDDIKAEMKASRNNCDVLKSVFQNYILPNVG